MDAHEFVQWLQGRRREDIEWMLRALEHAHDTADGTVCWVRATQEVGAALRRKGQVREASQVAHEATEAALRACAETGLSAVDRSGATRLARAAGEAARGLVAGPGSVGTDTLLRPFFGGTVLSPC